MKRSTDILTDSGLPVKILQFGSGSFLLGFAGWIVQRTNEKVGFNAGVAMVLERAATQWPNGFPYTVVLKGIRKEEFINEPCKVNIIQRIVDPRENFDRFLREALNPDLQFIISESAGEDSFSAEDLPSHGIASSISGRLTQLLYHRFTHNVDASILVLPTNPGEGNGTSIRANVLKYCSHWLLPPAFSTWITMQVTFCNTLADRMVSKRLPSRVTTNGAGSPQLHQDVIVDAEWFHQWVIEGPRWIGEMLPFKRAGLNVIYTDDLGPYQQRMTQILHGGYACMACVGSLAEFQGVRETIDHPVVGKYIRRIIYDDIVPVLPGELSDLEAYADATLDRFRNPGFDRSLSSIDVTFKQFKATVFPTFIAQAEANGIVDDRLIFLLAALIFYFHPANASQRASGENDLMSDIWKGESGNGGALVKEVLFTHELTASLETIPNLVDRTAFFLEDIQKRGIIEVLREI